MNTVEYDEQMNVFLDVITNEIEAIRGILSKTRGPTSPIESHYRLSLLVGTAGINSRYTDLNIPARCYRRISDTQHAQGFIKKKMSLYKRLIIKLYDRYIL